MAAEIVLSGSLPLHGVNGTALIDQRTAATSTILESYLFGTQIPASAIYERQVLKVVMWGQMSSTGTLNVRLRAGSATATSSADANILHNLAFPAATTTNQWIRYEAFVTVTARNSTNIVVAGVGHGWTGASTTVGPANAVAEKTITLPEASPWSISLSAVSSNSSSIFRVRHAVIQAL